MSDSEGQSATEERTMNTAQARAATDTRLCTQQYSSCHRDSAITGKATVAIAATQTLLISSNSPSQTVDVCRTVTLMC